MNGPAGDGTVALIGTPHETPRSYHPGRRSPTRAPPPGSRQHVLVLEAALHQLAVDVGVAVHDALRLLHLYERVREARRLLPAHRGRAVRLAVQGVVEP